MSIIKLIFSNNYTIQFHDVLQSLYESPPMHPRNLELSESEITYHDPSPTYDSHIYNDTVRYLDIYVIYVTYEPPR